MKNFRQPGDKLTVVAPTGGVTVGRPVLIGGLLGVPETTEIAAADVVIYTKGVFDLAKSVDTEHGAFDLGDTLYWDAANNVLTKNPEAGARFGIAIVAAIAATTTVEALLDPFGAAGASGTGPEGVTELTAPAGGVTVGLFVEVVGIHGVVLNAAAATEAMYVQTRGTVDVALVDDATNGVGNEGDPMYWDESAGNITKTTDTGANALVGHLVKAAAQSDPTARIRLYG